MDWMISNGIRPTCFRGKVVILSCKEKCKGHFWDLDFLTWETIFNRSNVEGEANDGFVSIVIVYCHVFVFWMFIMLIHRIRRGVVQ